jgi:hypothetical protein
MTPRTKCSLRVSIGGRMEQADSPLKPMADAPPHAEEETHVGSNDGSVDGGHAGWRLAGN